MNESWDISLSELLSRRGIFTVLKWSFVAKKNLLNCQISTSNSPTDVVSCCDRNEEYITCKSTWWPPPPPPPAPLPLWESDPFRCPGLMLESFTIKSTSGSNHSLDSKELKICLNYQKLNSNVDFLFLLEDIFSDELYSFETRLE